MLQRLLNQGALGPIRGELDNRCILNEGDHQVSPIGRLSSDGKHCEFERDVKDKKTGKKLRTQVQQIPIGQPVYRDPGTGRVCLTRNTKSKKDCPALLDGEHNRPLASGTEVGYHGALAIVDWTHEKADKVKGAAHLLTNPAELTTAGLQAKDRAVQAASSAVATLKDPNKAEQAAHDAWNRSIDAAHGALDGAVNWYNLPTQKKLDGMAEGAVKGGLDVSATVVLGVVGKTGLEVAKAGELAESAKVLQTGHTLAAEAAATEQTVAEAGKTLVQRAVDSGTHAALPKGGTYMLVDEKTGQVMRTGRTKDLKRRKLEHQRDPETRQFPMKNDPVTDDYMKQRGREQLLHDQHNPPLNKIRPIGPNNPNRQKYLDAAKQLEEDAE